MDAKANPLGTTIKRINLRNVLMTSYFGILPSEGLSQDIQTGIQKKIQVNHNTLYVMKLLYN
jgi:hypothetical protein